MKRRERQRGMGKIYPTERRVPENSNERKEAFLNKQCEEIQESNRTGKTRDLFKKIKISREQFIQSFWK